MKRYFDQDDFVIALLLAIVRLADPNAERLGPPPARMASGTGRFDGLDWDDPEDPADPADDLAGKNEQSPTKS
jgi:hypothetical protein